MRTFKIELTNASDDNPQMRTYQDEATDIPEAYSRALRRIYESGLKSVRVTGISEVIE